MNLSEIIAIATFLVLFAGVVVSAIYWISNVGAQGRANKAEIDDIKRKLAMALQQATEISALTAQMQMVIAQLNEMSRDIKIMIRERNKSES